MTVRPTLRCLREDLRLPIPSATTQLDQIEHPLPAKAREQFADPHIPHERIRAIDDTVLFKVKIGRWREAVHCDNPDAEIPAWLVSAGLREDGHETYVAIRITGSVPPEFTAVILHRVPGCAPDAWFPESSLPEREVMPAEQVWSNMMDPKEAARLLEDHD
ncbi:hypothetical protein ACFWUP_13945 [Nocardia sp. NPDC058658]|uniref:hypothetical protein n=1 Tax=Nocardia sp. NPDC058658 TaxID=3346580 RepID=UPI003663D30F